jgi:diguanylate cyclase (GGDEF)-like protein
VSQVAATPVLSGVDSGGPLSFLCAVYAEGLFYVVPALVNYFLCRGAGYAALCVATIAGIYALLDLSLNRFAFSDGWTIIWPLNGLTIAILIASPRRLWAPIVVGVEMGTALGEWLDHNAILFETGQRICSAIEVLICAWALPAFRDLHSWLQTPRISQRFLGAVIAGPGVSGLMAAVLFHVVNGQAYAVAFNNWATADALGIAATMPFALAVGSPAMKQLFNPGNLGRTLAILLLTSVAGGLIFGQSYLPLGFLFYPVLLLTDLLLGFAGASIVVIIVSLMSIYYTTNAHGPFGHWSPSMLLPRDLAFQLYFGFHLLALFPASVVLMERRRMSDDLRAANLQLTGLASIDALTGLANRRIFDQRFEQEWRRALEEKQALALVMIDLDHFKQYNDRYGHLAGDRCLRQVADCLARYCRYPDSLVSRFGGEEFALLLPHRGGDEVLLIVEELRRAVYALALAHPGSPVGRITISIGFSVIQPLATDTPATLIQLADAALYQAKRNGRNRAETITSAAGLQAAEEHLGDSTRIRLLRLISGR